eukprot:CAMPEP_0203746888 /NCGR_PEP_ID=MMETSP0098-20131031/2193_1 /ASSEMBLY_ACC=CAM_ASM_000208 /TAXON_ID=96639 /ORGANISM=" , Strain NY0313808BC1" /LENGTH=897 /DNA_ID=CAMNT_0050635141 /DNA_START=129 /DNA_END=2823 /DNA_ORIENTATION=+
MGTFVENARLTSGSGSGRERATPHKLALCVLVQLYVSPDEGGTCRLSPIQVRELQLFLVQSIKRVDNIIEPVLVEICREIEKTITNGEMVAEYLKNVLRGIDSPDSLFDLLEVLRQVLLPPSAVTCAVDVDPSGCPTHIEYSCIFGVFIRRVLLSCKRSFEALSRLFHEIGLFSRAATSGAMIPGITPRHKPGQNLKRKMSFELEQEALEAEEAEKANKDGAASRLKQPNTKWKGQRGLHSAATFRSFVSRRQLQYHLHCIVGAIESKIGIVSPEQIESEVGEMLAVSPDLPRAHFVRYLNCLMHREYQGAVDSLHTYFDYCMRSGGPTSSAAIATASAAAAVASGGRATHGSAAIHASSTLGRRRPMMQYAVLNLAALHYQFGHRREAMLAIQETVRVAQQNGDHVCVVFALSWLYRLASGDDGQETTQLLRRCLNRARDLGLYHVQGLSHLVTAQYCLVAATAIPTAMPPPIQGFNAHMAGKNVPAQAVWRALQRGVSASSNSLESYVEAVTTVMNGRSRGSGQRGAVAHGWNQGSSQPDELAATGMPDHASRAAMSQAIKAVNASLATPSSHLSSAMTTSGRAQLMQSIAWETYGHTSLSWLSSLTHLNSYSGLQGTAASDTCLAICRLACAQAKHGNLSSLCPQPKQRSACPRNAYVGALLLLLQAKQRYQYRPNNIMVLNLVYLLQERAIARGDISEAMLLGSTLRALSPSQQSVSGIGGSFFGEDLHVNTQALWVDTLRVMGRIAEAHALTHALIDRCKGVNLYSMREEMDLTLSQIFLDSNSSAVSALPYTLRCLSRSEKNGQETLFNAAAIKLASTQFRMGYVHRALALALQALPHIAAHGKLVLNGELYLLLGKCYLVNSSDKTIPGHARKEYLKMPGKHWRKRFTPM